MSTSASTGIAVVTGASRGVGRGVAEALGAAGMTVYVTGRSTTDGASCIGDTPLHGTIHDAAAAVTAAGGQGIAVQCDHADDAQVKALFARIANEHGRLDILVNNALWRDPELAARSGRTQIVAELAQHYGVRDEDGREPPTWRDILGAPCAVHPARVS